MLKFLFSIKLFLYIIIPGYTFAQGSQNDLSEKKITEDVFTMYNNGKVEEVYKLAHQLEVKLKTDYGLCNINLLLANYFNNKSSIDSSLYYVHQSQKYHKSLTDSLRIRARSRAFYIMGNCYDKMGLYEESRKCYLKGILEAEKFKNEELYDLHTHGLALNYLSIGEYAKALELFNKIINTNTDLLKYNINLNMGVAYSELKNYDMSEKYFKKALELNKKNQKGTTVIYINLAANADDQRKWEEALMQYEKAIKIAERNNYHALAIISRKNIAGIYFKQKKYKDARLKYDFALSEAKKRGLLKLQLIIYEELKEMAIEQEDYKEALDFSSKFFELKDSIATLQKNKELNELEVQYRTSEKEKEIKFLKIENTNKQLEIRNQKEAIENLKLKQEIENIQNEIDRIDNTNKLLEAENSKERKNSEIAMLKKEQELQEARAERQSSINTILIYSFLILLIPILSLMFLYYQKLQTQNELNKTQKEISNRKIDAILKDQELEVIKAAMDGQDKERKRIAQELHDSIGGNLAAIRLQLNTISNLKNEQIDLINKQLDETYEQVRDLSHDLIPKKFSRNKFSEVVEEYLQNIRDAGSLNTTSSIYPRKKIDQLNELVQTELFKIIQELVTNTIKHSKARVAELHLNLSNDRLNLLFEDNGIGFDPENLKEGIGLDSIKCRLKKLNGVMAIDSKHEKGALINIEIPKPLIISKNV